MNLEKSVSRNGATTQRLKSASYTDILHHPIGVTGFLFKSLFFFAFVAALRDQVQFLG